MFFGANAMQSFSSPNCELIHNCFHTNIYCGTLMKKYGSGCEKVYYSNNNDEATKIIQFYYLYKKIFGISPQKDLEKKGIQTARMLMAKNSL